MCRGCVEVGKPAKRGTCVEFDLDHILVMEAAALPLRVDSLTLVRCSTFRLGSSLSPKTVCKATQLLRVHDGRMVYRP